MHKQTSPPAQVPIADTASNVTNEWLKYFSSISQKPGPIETIDVGPSPFIQEATINGWALVSGGTVSGIELTRGRVTVTTGLTAGFVPMSLGDQITVTYSVLPNLYFMPFWGGAQDG